MIKIKALLESWTNSEYGPYEVQEEFKRLNNAIWSFYENGLISGDKMKEEWKKLYKATEIMLKKLDKENNNV